MIKQNLHTHSIYCDGRDTVDEMVQEAVRKGFTVLGFSGHGPCAADECAMSEDGLEHYIRDVKNAREKYRDQIRIFLGIEEDMLQRISSKEPYDFVIGRQALYHGERADQERGLFRGGEPGDPGAFRR